MPKKIEDYTFSAADRGRLNAVVMIQAGDEAHAYVRTLEMIAEAARNYADNSTPVNANKLNELLSKVDWMRP